MTLRVLLLVAEEYVSHVVSNINVANKTVCAVGSMTYMRNAMAEALFVSWLEAHGEEKSLPTAASASY